jgi:protein TonB
MRWVTVTVVGSAALHLALLSGLQEMPQPKFQESEDIKVFVSKPKPPKPPRPETPPKPPPTPPEPVKTPHANPRPALKPKAPPPEPPPEAPAPKSAKDFAPGLSDFGISMSGTSAGGGIAVGPGGGGVGSGSDTQAKPKTVVHEKTLTAKKPSEPAADQCDEALVKAKPKGFVQPAYTDDARAAGVEGRVRLRITIDASGNVSSASVLSGLGHGLDQAAVAAARRMKFSPATKCGKPVQSSFVISMRFVLGE